MFLFWCWLFKDFAKEILKDKIDISLSLDQQNQSQTEMASLVDDIRRRWRGHAAIGQKHLYDKEQILSLIEEMVVNPKFRDGCIPHYFNKNEVNNLPSHIIYLFINFKTIYSNKSIKSNRMECEK